MTRFFYRQKKQILIAAAAVFIMAVAAVLIWGFLIGGNDIDPSTYALTGNQIGDISLVRLSDQETVFSSNIKDMNKSPAPAVLEGSSFYAGVEGVNTVALDGANTSVEAKDYMETAPESVTLPTTDRALEKVGEIGDYIVVAGTIYKGDYWLKVQKEILPSIDPTSLLLLGKTVNPEGRVHPIYPGERVLFLYREDLPVQNTADKVPKLPTLTTEIPQEHPDPSLDSDDEDIVVSDYFYQFSESGLYVLDNLSSTVFEIVLSDKQLSLKPLSYLGEGMVADSFCVSGNAVYFSIAQNDVFYVSREGKLDRIYCPEGQEVWTVIDDDLYFAAQQALYKVDSKSGSFKSVYLGESSSDILATETFIYVSNDFGYNNFRSVVHCFDRDLSSLGWAETYYAVGAQIMAAPGILMVNQNVQNQYSKIVFVNEDLSIGKERQLDQLFKKLSFDKNYLYGMKDKSLYLYDCSGKPIADFRVGGTDAFLIYFE